MKVSDTVKKDLTNALRELECLETDYRYAKERKAEKQAEVARLAEVYFLAVEEGR